MKKNKDKDKKEGPGVLGRAIMALIVALIVVIYLNLRVSRYPNISDELGWVGMTGWAWSVFCLAIFFAVFAFAFFLVNIKRRKERLEQEQLTLTEEEKKQKRRKRLNIIFLIITLLATGLYISYNYDQLVLWGLAKAIPAIALFFGLVFMAFELFSFIKPSVFDKLVRLPWDILMKVIVPMMPFVIILLGVIQTWYPTNYPFLDETAKGLRSAFFIGSNGVQKVVITLYNLGLERPSLWFALIIGAFIVMLYFVIKEIFVEEEITEENMLMEDFLKTIPEFDEEEEEKNKRWMEIKSGAQMRWYEKILYKLDGKDGEERREKRRIEPLEDAKANAHAIKYDIEFKKK